MSVRERSGSALPAAMTVFRATDDVVPGPSGATNGDFSVQTLLGSRVDGEMTAMRAVLPVGVTTDWHSHPRGQFLIAVAGVGTVQRAGGEIVEIRTGDSVWFAPGERHRHGATPVTAFSYVSIQPVQDGATVHWPDLRSTTP